MCQTWKASIPNVRSFQATLCGGSAARISDSIVPGPLNYGSFYSLYFRPAVIAALPAHLHSLRFHDLRHTYASLLVKQGAHAKEMAELLGHASVQITLDRYSHVMPV